MRRSLLLLIGLVLTGLMKGALVIETTGTNEYVVTVGAADDLKNVAGDDLSKLTSATKLTIKTATGVELSSDDCEALKSNCSSLATLDLADAEMNRYDDLSDKIKYISMLKSITFPRTVGTIKKGYIQWGSAKIQEVIIPDDDEHTIDIAEEAFVEDGSELKRIVFGTSVRTIGVRACQNLTAITELAIHEGVTTIGDYAFQGTTGLSTVTLPESLRTLGSFAFFGSGLVTARMLYGIETIGADAFHDCTSLTSVVLPESLTSIGSQAFQNTALQTVRIPSRVTVIRQGTFVRCTQLESVTIPDGVEQIEADAFNGNTALKDVYVMGATVKCAYEAFKPTIPYGRDYSEYSAGVTTLHYPAAAATNYANCAFTDANSYFETDADGNSQFKSTLGSTEYSEIVDYFSNPCQEKYTGNYNRSDYTGWHQFMNGGAYTPEEDVFIEKNKVGDRWYSMCYPFPVSEKQLKSAFGEDVEVVEFSGVEVSESGETKTLTLKFKTPVTETVAYHPYMIHPGYHAGNETGTGIVNYIVGIEKAAEPEEMPRVEHDADGVTYSFVGNCATAKAMKQYSYYYAGGNIGGKYYPVAFYKTLKTTSTFSQYTAVVELSKDNGINNAKASIFTTLETEQETPDESLTTSMARLAAKPTEQGVVRNLNGQIVSKGTAGLNGLPKGIYIVNGKKTVVR